MRIRELEQKLEEVQRSVAREQRAELWTPSTSEASTTPASTTEQLLAPSRIPVTSPGRLVSRESPNQLPAKEDPVARGIIEESLTEELCIQFCTEPLPRYPLILPPVPLSWRALQRHRPALLPGDACDGFEQFQAESLEIAVPRRREICHGAGHDPWSEITRPHPGGLGSRNLEPSPGQI